ncbi:Cnrip1 [Columba guinea]|nr:Cnrip1 [Columba guinea]
MGDIPNLVKISVSLKIQPNDGAVYFKVDGQRFGQNRTIKLLTGAKYKIEVAIRPGTVQATTMGIGGVSVPLEEKSRDAQVASYTGIYDTEGVAHTKSGERQPIQVNMQEVKWQRSQKISCFDYGIAILIATSTLKCSTDVNSGNLEVYLFLWRKPNQLKSQMK